MNQLINPSVHYPHFKAFCADGVPDELKTYAQWITWKLEKERDEPGKKPTKVPYSPISGLYSGCSEKFRNLSWSSFDNACNAYNSGAYAGVSFAITQQDPFVFIDFDHCVNDGVIHPDVLAWINKLGGYTEFSPSGTGIHILLRGKKPGIRCRSNGSTKEAGYDIEVYEKDRFTTITGQVIDGFCQIGQNQEALTELYNEHIHVPEPETTNVKPADISDIPVDDQELIRHIRASKQGAKFDSLMAGDTSAYKTGDNEGHSNADMALCLILSAWTGGDELRIDRIFRTSGLMREKWDRSSGACSYGQRTIQNAIKNTTWFWEGKQSSQQLTKRTANGAGVSAGENVVPIENAAKKKAEKKKGGHKTLHFTKSAIFPDKPLYDFKKPPWGNTGSYYRINPFTGDLHVGGDDTGPGEIVAQSPIWVHCRAKNLFDEYSIVVKFFNYDRQETTLSFPAAILSDAGGILGKQLRTLGMPLISGKEKYVNRYIDQMAKWRENTAWIAEKIGWFEGVNPPAFVLPTVVLGQKDDAPEIFYQPTLQQDSQSLNAKGTLADWQSKILKPTKNNPLLLFGILTGLAGPINKLAKGESGGFHFCGDTSTGKTAVVQAAASVWGNASDPQNMADRTSIRKWKATVNGLEAYAQLHNDIVLCLDEIGSARPDDVSDSIYLLTGGLPKGRSNIDGGSRRQPTWHTLLVSSGELTIEQIMRQAGQEQKGGQRHRLPDIRCDTTGTGVVYDLSLDTLAKRSEFVASFKELCANYYGVAGPAFVTWIISQMNNMGVQGFSDQLRTDVRKYADHLMNDMPTLPSEGRRFIQRLAIVGIAGRYASQKNVGILNIDQRTIDDAVITIRDLWCESMDAEKSEALRTIEYFKHQVLSNPGNFIYLEEEEPKKPIKCYGYVSYKYYLIFPNSFDDLCGLHPKSTVLRVLEESGNLDVGEPRKDRPNGKPRQAKKANIVHSKFKARPRCYHIKRSFFDG